MSDLTNPSSLKSSILSSGLVELFIGTIICGGFGNSLDAVSPLAFIQSFLLIIGFHRFTQRNGKTNSWFDILKSSIVLICFGSIGCAIGFSSVFGLPKTTFGTIIQVWGFGLLLSFLLTLFSIIPTYLFATRIPSFYFQVLVYPATTTFVWHTFIGSILGTFIAPANAVIDSIPLSRVAFMIGIAGISFIVVFVCTIIYLSIVLPTNKSTRSNIHENEDDTSNRPYFILNFKYILYLIFIFIFITIGGFINVSESIYQKNVLDIIPRNYQDMSCLYAQYAKNGTQDYNDLLTNTETRLAAGDAVVLWSEEGVDVLNENEESYLLNQAQTLTKTYNKGYLGITYRKQIGNNLYTNQFALITPEGNIAWNYHKAYPVPLVEDNIQAGVAILPTYQTTNLGKLGGSICFDMDYPNFIRQAGSQHVDLMLHPSWTW